MNLFRSTYYCLLFVCLLRSSLALGQVNVAGVGVPPARVYLPKEYNAHSQNFALTQDRRGVLYVGNFAGVLEYDGTTWRTIPTQDTTKVSALLTARNGTTYVGANGEFGYLKPDSVGRLRFASLSLPLNARFNETLSILETGEGLFFVSSNLVFRWNGKTISQWASGPDITSAFTVGQSIYVFQRQRGLCLFDKGTFKPVTQRAGVPKLYDLQTALPLGENNALLITSSQGLFRLTNGVIEPFSSPADTYLAENQATGGAVLNDQTIVISTLRGGFVLLTRDGQLKQILQGASGLTDQLVNAMYADRTGHLWLALNSGLAQVEIPSPMMTFNASSQLTGEVMDIRRVKGTVYLATLNGLFRIDNSIIRPVLGLNASCFGLTEAAGSLVVATSKGVYKVIDGRAQLVTPGSIYALCLTSSKRNSSLVYVGTESGLSILTVSGTNTTYRPLPGLSERIFGILEDENGTIWLETLRAGLYQYTPATGQFRQYATLQGLPTLLYNRVAGTSHGLLAYTEKGIFRFDPAQDRFLAYNPFRNRASPASFWKDDMLEDQHGDIWTIEGDKRGITLYKKHGTAYRTILTPFLPLANVPINVIYPDEEGVVWFGGRDGVVRYDSKVRKAYDYPYPALIRRIQTKADKPIFEGFDLSGSDNLTLEYASNDIRFEFTATDYVIDNTLEFQYMLENYDKDWSEWSPVNKKEYTNLPAGSYTFRVRARNLYEAPSREAVFEFRVLPPWYGRWWVIGLGLVVGAVLIYSVVRWRLNVLVREKEALETLINERTEEVVSQKEELEKQSEELAVKNDQLEKIDLIVQAINAEVDLSNLFQTILAKFSVIRNMDSASFLIYDKPSGSFRYKALRSNRELAHVESVQLTQEQVEARFLAQAVEIYKDIYLKNDVHYEPLNCPVDDLITPRSLITIVIENEGRIEGFITLENTTRTNAFDERDISMIRNLKEHLIAAFIKTRLLEDLETTLNDLKNTQDELIRQERLASVGQLTKGIVDRILNPLNYVQNFSQSSDDLIDEVIDVLQKQQDTLPTDTLNDLLDELTMLKNNLSKIKEHSNSTTRILKDMQRLLREKSQVFLETDLNSFLESKARTALQEVKNDYKDFGINLIFNLENHPIRTRLLPHEFGQVVQYIVSNSYYTLYEKSKSANGFTPEVQIATKAENGQVFVRFRDNGKGIPQREVSKLFSPFFTTKPTSKGTGLGLFMTKDIIETHKGKISINTKEGEFTEILMTLPTIND